MRKVIKTTKNRKNKFKKFIVISKMPAISNYTKTAALLLISAVFVAAVLFTPLSGILSSYLKDEVEKSFSTFTLTSSSFPDSGKNPNINKIGEILINLTFAGIGNIYDLQDSGVLADSQNIQNASDLYSYQGSSIDSTSNQKKNPYENMPVSDDDSIMSVQELYEYYQTAGGAVISEAEQPDYNGSGTPRDVSEMYKITAVNFSGQKTKIPKLLISNQTSYNINLYDYISMDYPISKFDLNKTDEPIVLILDTHTTESYVEDGTAYYYPPFTAERSTDGNKSVVLIATELRKKLEAYGIPTVQSTKLHDAVSFQNSYLRSLETMTEYLQKYPSLKYIIDVHRDSIILATGEKYKPTIKINGKDSAQVMMVVGTPEGGASHPNWRDNLTFAAYLQQKMNDKYPMLARPINLRNARFNQHMTKGSIILEVGSCGSTFSEALYAADLVGECMAELILEHN